MIKLDADEAPVSFYVEQAIQHGKPLYLGVGATRIDRNSIVDRAAARQELEATTADQFKTATSAGSVQNCNQRRLSLRRCQTRCRR